MPRKIQPIHRNSTQRPPMYLSPPLPTIKCPVGFKNNPRGTNLQLIRFGRDTAPDERDKEFSVRQLLPKKAPTRVSRFWSDNKWWGDQGASPYCVGFACVHWLCDGPIYPKTFPPIKPVALYNRAQLVDEWEGTDYEGTSVRAGVKVLQSLGLVESYYWAFTVHDMVACLLEQGPMILGTNWYVGMMQPVKGFIKPTGAIVGGHAFCINGVNTKAEYFRIKQSWGRDWGDEGRTKITFKDMAKLLKEGGEACIAIETISR